MPRLRTGTKRRMSSDDDEDFQVHCTQRRTASKKMKTPMAERPWTKKEDEVLRKNVQKFKGSDWRKIADSIKERSDVQCLQRWQKVLNPNLVKGYWTKEEDEKLAELVELFGTKRWAAIARSIPGRIGKQCRERWHNHLDPSIKKDAWTEEEEMILACAHQKLGNKWASISKLLAGRSENAVKNHWNSTAKKRASRQVVQQEEEEEGVVSSDDQRKLSIFPELEGSDPGNVDSLTDGDLSWSDDLNISSLPDTKQPDLSDPQECGCAFEDFVII